MRKKVIEKKKIEVEKDVVISDTLHCNVCDKVINGGYWLVFSSVGPDPHIGKDICSGMCMNKVLDEYIKKSPERDDLIALLEVSYVRGTKEGPHHDKP